MVWSGESSEMSVSESPKRVWCSFTNFRVCRDEEIKVLSVSMAADLKPSPPSEALKHAWLVAALKVVEAALDSACCAQPSSGRRGFVRSLVSL